MPDIDTLDTGVSISSDTVTNGTTEDDTGTLGETAGAVVGNTAEVVGTETISAAAARKAFPIDTVNMTVTVDGVAVLLSDIPDAMQKQLALVGLRDALRNGKSVDELKAGTVRVSRIAAAPKALSPWRQAIVAAMIESTKKAAEPLTAATAGARVAILSKEQLAKLKTDPAVAKHYNRITNNTSALSHILHGTTEA